MIEEKLIFSPCYDGRVHIGFDKVRPTGVKYVGPLGLLAELELRAGLTCQEMDSTDRTLMMTTAVERYLETHPESMFKDSFDLDSNDVVLQILSWRDALVMAGWDETVSVDSSILKELALIEKEFRSIVSKQNAKGVADRWTDLLEYCKSHKLEGVSIEIALRDEEPINPTVREVLRAVCGDAYESAFMPPASMNPDIEAWSFDDEYDAFLMAALTLDKDRDVIVNQDTKAFNNFLNLMGMGNTKSLLKDCNAPILQLFKLQLLLLADKRNIFNMVSFLKTTPCPIRGGNRLGDYLMGHCGWGTEEDWQEFLVETYDKDGEKVAFLDERAREAVTSFKTDMQDTEAITSSKVRGHISALKHWAEKQTRAADNIVGFELSETQKAQLNTVKGYCNQLLDALGDDDRILEPSVLVKYAESIYRDGEYGNTEAFANSFMAYDSLGSIAHPADRVVWIDCYGDLFAEYDYDFLSQQDKKALESQGVRIWSKSAQISAKVSSLKDSALSCGDKLVLFIPKKSKGQTLAVSPLVTTLKLKPKRYEPEIETTTGIVEKLPERKLYYNLDAGITEHRKSTTEPIASESFSSLNLLIDFPLDYVMKYLAGLYPPNISNLEGISRIQGTVAHKTLENLGADCDHDANRMLSEIRTEGNLEKRIEDAAAQVGIVLLLKEHALDLYELKNKLKVSLVNLLEIIISNKLKIVGHEMEYNDEKSSITGQHANIEANIDLVLEDDVKKKYIFDLKYSHWKKYSESLASNTGKVLQLDLYKNCMSRDKNNVSEVVFTGFFMLTDGKLYTSDDCLHDKDGRIVVVKQKDDALKCPIEALAAGYQYRYQEFAKGRIEEGEGEPCKRQTARREAQERLDYFREQDTRNLYPLELDSGSKARNRYSDYTIFKGGLK